MPNNLWVESLEGRRVFSSVAAPSTTTLPDQVLSLVSGGVTSTGVSKSNLLDRLEAAVRGEVQYQNKDGALIDPIAKREIQYATPNFAYAISVLIANGRAKDLLSDGVAAMNWSSSLYAKGLSAIPDQHGEFYIYPLALTYNNFKSLVKPSMRKTWLKRLETPISDVIEGYDWNWRTYAMKGVWAMYRVGIMDHATAVKFIEDSWTGSQRDRIEGTALNMYEDRTSDPDTIAYNYAALANLQYLEVAGYDGASAKQIKSLVTKGVAAGLYLVDPTGQVSNTGRSGNHVWNDLVAAVTFERQAELLAKEGYVDTPASYQRAAAISVLSTDRWQNNDGLYQVTKNEFPATDERGFADYSGVTNYNGYMILHLSELATDWVGTSVGEQATPAETGGYALTTDTDYGTAVADAGGTQITAALRGQTSINYNQYWTQLGVTRVSSANWDSRLGNLSGEDPDTQAAFSLAPMIKNAKGKYVRMAEMPKSYTASFKSLVVSTEMTRVQITYTPRSKTAGLPTLVQTLTITRDGVLMNVTTTGTNVAVTLPLLTNDGTKLTTSTGRTAASTAYTKNGDSLNYLLLDSGAAISDPGTAIKGSTGNYDPLVASRSGASSLNVFIYTRQAGATDADTVQATTKVKGYGFTNTLGRVVGDTYVGSRVASGFGVGVDLDGDGDTDVRFASPTDWVLKLNKSGKVTAVETGEATHVTYHKVSYAVHAATVKTL